MTRTTLRGARVPLAALSLVIVVGCASTESAEKSDPPVDVPAEDAPPSTTEAPADPAPPPGEPTKAEPAPATSAPPADAAPAPAASTTPDGFQRSKDGIDDDNPLPRDTASEAAVAFQRASDTARTDAKAAAQQFADAAGKTTYFYAAWFNAGSAYEAAGDAANAERAYKEALKVRPDFGPALANLYLLYRGQNRMADANRVVDDALKSQGDRAGPHLAAATRAHAGKDVSTTENEARETLRLDERSVPAMRLMAWVFFEQKRFESAAFALENALKLEPGNALLHMELGHVQLKLKEERKALESFGRAAKLRPELADAQENYGVLMLQYGEVDEGVAALQKVVERRPQSAAAHLHVGNGLRAQKKYVEAETAYKKALTLDPKLASAHFNLGLLYIDNELPGVDYLDRLKRAEASFAAFTAAGSSTKELDARVDDYEGTLKKLIAREEKKRQRDAERKAIDDEKKAKADATKAPAEGAPAEGTPAEGAPPEGTPSEGVK